MTRRGWPVAVCLAVMACARSSTETTCAPCEAGIHADLERLGTSLSLPTSNAVAPVSASVRLVVSREGMWLQGVDLGVRPEVGADGELRWPESAARGVKLVGLFDQLLSLSEERERIESTSRDQDVPLFERRIALVFDESLPFSMVRKVIDTVGQAQYAHLEVVVRRDDGHGLAAVSWTLPTLEARPLDERQVVSALLLLRPDGTLLAPQAGPGEAVVCEDGPCTDRPPVDLSALHRRLRTVPDEARGEGVVIIVGHRTSHLHDLLAWHDAVRWRQDEGDVRAPYLMHAVVAGGFE
jgi:hypothetical protein